MDHWNIPLAALKLQIFAQVDIYIAKILFLVLIVW